ncbi:MAG TPA: sensor histidine kinase [Symbiobacteriaceae bacterium]|nr:sensor histidine kinase [Symbiobacteriaceae bacterium]
MQKRFHPEKAFLWLVYLFLAAIWLITVDDPGMRQWQVLVPFTVLLAVHGFLHGAIFRWGVRDTALVYVAVQALLAGALVILGRGKPMVAALFFPLAGEAFGLFPDARRRIVALAGITALWSVTVWVTGDPASFRVQVPGAVLGLIFVAVYVTMFTRQTAERERAEKLLAQLEDAHRQLGAYAVQVEELTIAQERQRMARELHDTLAQGLAGLIMQLEAVDAVLARGDAAKAREINTRAMERARTTLVEARRTIQDLRSPLEHGDLVEAIFQVAERTEKETGIRCILEAGPGNFPLPEPVAAQVYRVVQEGLANIARHSRASEASVRLSVEGGQVHLEIIDDGAGFDPAAVPPGHFGLIGLKERMRLMGGTLQIDSEPGHGTRLHATLPLQEE